MVQAMVLYAVLVQAMVRFEVAVLVLIPQFLMTTPGLAVCL